VLKQLKALFTGQPHAGQPQVLGPTTLHVYTNISCQLNCHMCYGHSPLIRQNLWQKSQQLGSKDMDYATFQYILGFVPYVSNMVFSGWGEPTVNPDLFKMIFLAHTAQKARSTLVTNGLLLDARMDELMASPLAKLVVSINGFSPSSYHAITGMQPEVFGSVYRQVKSVLAHKRAASSLLPVWLSMVVNTETVFQVPQMVQLAYELQVDGLELVNDLGPEPGKPYEKTITADRASLIAYLQAAGAEKHPFTLQLPTIMPPPGQAGQAHQCQDPHQVIAVDGDCNVSACSRWVLFDGHMAKIWDADFWHAEKISWLRQLHSPQGNPQDLPRPCQNCPKACGV
jgi:MoaA/NifB/PqqE/SkfB family radical SAM enzyme